MMTSRLFAVTFDCADAAVAGGFWARALGQELDPGAGKEFASIGLHDSGRAGPRWCFAQVPEGKFSVQLLAALSSAQVSGGHSSGSRGSATK